MRKRMFSQFGMAIKTKLLESGQTQEWLIERAKEQTGMYIDSSNLYKIMTGQVSSPKIQSAIIEILGLESA